MRKVLAEDESWAQHYDPEIKVESGGHEYKTSISPKLLYQWQCSCNHLVGCGGSGSHEISE